MNYQLNTVFRISSVSAYAKCIRKAFTAANIKAVNVVFTPGTDFDGLIERAKFNPVASRTAQAATLKAEKEGLSTVDLEAAKG